MYNGSMIAALLHVFPELPWDEAKFGNLRSKLGESREGGGEERELFFLKSREVGCDSNDRKLLE